MTFGYNKIGVTADASARAWLEEQLQVSEEQRIQYIETHNLLPISRAKKWSAVIHTDKNDDLFKHSTYQNELKYQVKTTNANVTQQTNIISQETKALIDLEIRLERLKEFKDGTRSVPHQHYSRVEGNRLIDKEISKLIKQRNKIDEKLTNSNKKLIEQRLKILMGLMKRGDLLTAVERRNLIHDYFQDQMKELNIEFNQTAQVNGANLRESLRRSKIDDALDSHKSMGARQSLESLKEQLTLLNEKALAPVKPIIKQITKQVSEAINVLQKSLAKELKENTAALNYIESQIRKPPKVQSSQQAIKQVTQQAIAMITVLEKRAHLLSGKAYQENQNRTLLWRNTLAAIREGDANTAKKALSKQFVYESPKLSLNRKEYVTNVNAAYQNLKENFRPVVSASDKKSVQLIFSNLAKNIENTNTYEQRELFARQLSVTEWRENISQGFKNALIAGNDPIAKMINQVFEDYLVNKKQYRLSDKKNATLSSDDINDQAKICYAIYYALMAREVNSRETFIKSLQSYLNDAGANINSPMAKEKLRQFQGFVNGQAKVQEKEMNRTPISDKSVLPPPLTRNRAASLSSASPRGFFGGKLPPAPPIPNLSEEAKLSPKAPPEPSEGPKNTKK